MVVTGASSSRPRLIDDRQRKYLIAMSLRSLSFLVAVALYLIGLKWEAAGVLGISLLTPIIAVVAANSHAPPREGTAQFYATEPDPTQPRIDYGSKGEV